MTSSDENSKTDDGQTNSVARQAPPSRLEQDLEALEREYAAARQQLQATSASQKASEISQSRLASTSQNQPAQQGSLQQNPAQQNRLPQDRVLGGEGLHKQHISPQNHVVERAAKQYEMQSLLAELRAELSQTKAGLLERDHLLQKTNHQILELETRLRAKNDASAALTHSQIELTTARREISRLKALLEARSDERDELAAFLDSKRREYFELENQLTLAVERLEKGEQLNAEMALKVTQLEKDHIQVEQDQKRREEVLETARVESFHSKKVLEDLRSERVEYEKRLAKLRGLLERRDNQVAYLNRRIDAVDAEREEALLVERDLREANRKNVLLERELKRSQQKLDEFQTKIAGSRRTIETLAERTFERDELQRQIKKLEAQLLKSQRNATQPAHLAPQPQERITTEVPVISTSATTSAGLIDELANTGAANTGADKSGASERASERAASKVEASEPTNLAADEAEDRYRASRQNLEGGSHTPRVLPTQKAPKITEQPEVAPTLSSLKLQAQQKNAISQKTHRPPTASPKAVSAVQDSAPKTTASLPPRASGNADSAAFDKPNTSVSLSAFSHQTSMEEPTFADDIASVKPVQLKSELGAKPSQTSTPADKTSQTASPSQTASRAANTTSRSAHTASRAANTTSHAEKAPKQNPVVPKSPAASTFRDLIRESSGKSLTASAPSAQKHAAKTAFSNPEVAKTQRNSAHVKKAVLDVPKPVVQKPVTHDPIEAAVFEEDSPFELSVVESPVLDALSDIPAAKPASPRSSLSSASTFSNMAARSDSATAKHKVVSRPPKAPKSTPSITEGSKTPEATNSVFVADLPASNPVATEPHTKPAGSSIGQENKFINAHHLSQIGAVSEGEDSRPLPNTITQRPSSSQLDAFSDSPISASSIFTPSAIKNPFALDSAASDVNPPTIDIESKPSAPSRQYSLGEQSVLPNVQTQSNTTTNATPTPLVQTSVDVASVDVASVDVIEVIDLRDSASQISSAKATRPSLADTAIVPVIDLREHNSSLAAQSPQTKSHNTADQSSLDQGEPELKTTSETASSTKNNSDSGVKQTASAQMPTAAVSETIALEEVLTNSVELAIVDARSACIETGLAPGELFKRTAEMVSRFDLPVEVVISPISMPIQGVPSAVGVGVHAVEGATTIAQKVAALCNGAPQDQPVVIISADASVKAISKRLEAQLLDPVAVFNLLR